MSRVGLHETGDHRPWFQVVDGIEGRGLNAEQDIGARQDRGRVGEFGVFVGLIGEMGGNAGAALDQDAGAQGLQFARNLGSECHAGFIGGALLQDPHDDRHAIFPSNH